MTDDELLLLFDKAVVLYIKNNGETPEYSKYKLIFNPAVDEVPRIENWKYTFDKPTKQDLKKLNKKAIKQSYKEDHNVPERVREMVQNNFGLFVQYKSLIQHSGLSQKEANDFMIAEYSTFFDID